MQIKMPLALDKKTIEVTMTDEEAARLCRELLWAKIDDDGPAMDLWTALSEAGYGD